MKQPPYRVVFMGCPDFAVPILSALLADRDFVVKAVYSMPDRPKGRGQKTCFTPVKTLATGAGIEVRCPGSLRANSVEWTTLGGLSPDFLVVVAYGLILPKEVLAIPALGAVNVHASLLPAYRGPSPIHQALLNGDRETGNTIMLMNEKMDEGDILKRAPLAIAEEETLSSLHDRLSAQGAELLPGVLKDYARGTIVPTPQDHSRATYTKKIVPEMARLDWGQDALVLKRLVQAMSPCPGAWFELDGERFKVGRVTLGGKVAASAGTIVAASVADGLHVACGSGTSLNVETMQRPGKGMVPVRDFLRGLRVDLTGRVLA